MSTDDSVYQFVLSGRQGQNSVVLPVGVVAACRSGVELASLLAVPKAAPEAPGTVLVVLGSKYLSHQAWLRSVGLACGHDPGDAVPDRYVQSKTKFRGNLSTADLTRARLLDCTFTDCRADDVIFKEAELGGSRFCFTSLQRTDFSGASLEGADFRGANLREARFVGADLRRASFIAAHVSATAFVGADLGGVAWGMVEPPALVRSQKVEPPALVRSQKEGRRKIIVLKKE